MKLPLPGSRVSVLPLARYCGLAPKLSREHGAGRSAAMSTAYHTKSAFGADHPQTRKARDRLTPAELQEIDRWKEPGDVPVEGGSILKYADARKERPLGIGVYREPLPWGDPACLTQGHPDMFWIVTVGDRRIAYVGDIKRSEWTTIAGPDDLQLMVYALIVCAHYDCCAFATGIWAAEEGSWTWSDLRHLDDPFGDWDEDDAWTTIVNAATNQETSTGPHCRGCWYRQFCPEYQVPPDAALATLGNIQDVEQISEAQALQLLDLCKRAEETAKNVRENLLRRWADIHDGIHDGNGMVWKRGPVKGRPKVDWERIERDYPGLRDEYTTRGAPSSQYTWRKE